MEDLASSILDEVVQTLCLEVILDVHKNWKLGKLCLKCTAIPSASGASDDVTTDSSVASTDVFGQPAKANSNYDKVAVFSCIHCKRQVMPSRYAPHLEKVRCLARIVKHVQTKSHVLLAISVSVLMRGASTLPTVQSVD
jgi:hypothetical protein